MANETSIKKTVGRRKTIISPPPPPEENSFSPKSPSFTPVSEAFGLLLEKINQAQTEFESLEKEIAATRETWLKEQKEREQRSFEEKETGDRLRKREEEIYEYETNLARRKAEDEFAEKRAVWEKELAGRKEEIGKERRELEELRRAVAGFEAEKEKAVKTACAALQNELTGQFGIERKLRDQEDKSEKELLGLRLEGLTKENNRQTGEIESLKKALEEATRQLKEIAVKIIETGGRPQEEPEKKPA